MPLKSLFLIYHDFTSRFWLRGSSPVNTSSAHAGTSQYFNYYSSDIRNLNNLENIQFGRFNIKGHYNPICGESFSFLYRSYQLKATTKLEYREYYNKIEELLRFYDHRAVVREVTINGSAHLVGATITSSPYDYSLKALGLSSKIPVIKVHENSCMSSLLFKCKLAGLESMCNNKYVKIYPEQAPIIYGYTSRKAGPDPLYEYRIAFDKLHKEGLVMLDLTEYNNPT